MEANNVKLIANCLASVCVVLVLKVLWSISDWVWFRPKRIERCLREQGFEGNSYRLLHGDTKDRERMLVEARSKPMSHFTNDNLSRLHPFFHQTLLKYGKRCFIWNGPVPMVNVGEPELIREVFMKYNEFQKAKFNPYLTMIATGLVQVEGHVWSKHRKLLNPAFHMDKLRLMLPAFRASVTAMIEEWEEKATETGSCEVEIWSHLHKLSADVISRAAFGSSYKEGSRIFELMNQQLMAVIPLLNSVYIPGWRFLPTRENKKLKEINREIRNLLKGVIETRKKAIDAGESPKDDLLGILLESSGQHIRHGNDKLQQAKLDIEEVIDEFKIFYLAGQETTSSLLVWTLILLGKHQDWQARAREEVLATFGDQDPDFHQMHNLKTVNMILQEVLRLYPPVTELTRTVTKDIKVGDIFLPAGVLVNLPMLLIQHDEKIWGEDAKEFKPERFKQGISKASGGNMSFFTFGWGPRICIGSNFAMTEAKMTLVLILQRFSFELSPLYVHAPSAVGTFRPQFGAPINFHRL